MYEKFKTKQPGDRLSTGFINRLTKSVMRNSRFRVNNSGHGHSGVIQTNTFQIHPFPELFKILEVNGDGTYNGERVAYSRTADEWKPYSYYGEQSTGHVIDGRPTGAALVEGQIISAMWFPQGSRWIPTSSGSVVLRAGKVYEESITYPGNGQVRIWEDLIETETTLEGVAFDWASKDGEVLEVDTEVIVGFFPLENAGGGLWRIIGASCP